MTSEDVSQRTARGSQSAIDEKEKKKLRNRLSQRAFRRRQAEQMRELQSRINAGQQTESEAMASLQKENRMLRAQLVEVHSKMSRLLTSMEVLTGSVSKILDDSPEHESSADTSESDNLRMGNSPDRRSESILVASVEDQFDQQLGPLGHTDNSQQHQTDLLHQLLGRHSSHHQHSFLSQTHTGSIDPFSNHDSLLESELFHPSHLPQQLPNIWSFEYQMGPQAYLSAVAAKEHSSLMIGQSWTDTNSPFSDHIQVLQTLLKGKLDRMSLTPETAGRSLYQSISVVLAMFNSITRPDVMIWYAQTRFYHIIELTAWIMFPSARTFEKLHERYRPTDIQNRIPHPRVIDWIPFPSIRDKLIQLHAANPQIDQIFCDAVTGYVVEASLSDLVVGAAPTKAYIRVTDLITCMNTGSNQEGSSLHATLPAPDVETLFKSPACARLVFQKLNMDRGASYYKIDPAFFGKYPELYDSNSNIAASGIPLKPETQIRLSYPSPLDPLMYGTYRSFIEFSLNAFVGTYPLR